MSGFVFNARFEAKTIFQQLDPRFEPRLFFVGFPISGKSARSSVAVGPDGTPFRPEAFASVRRQAEAYEKADPENGSYWTDEGMQQRKELQIRLRALRKATQEAVEASPANCGRAAFCSWPVEHEGSHLIMILQLQQDVLAAYHTLSKGTYRERDLHEYRLERSLVEAVAFQYLEATAAELRSAHPGAGWYNIEDKEHLVLKAAKRLMQTPAVAGGNDQGLHGLYEACNTLSTLKYEGEDGVGRIVFARRDHPALDIRLALVRPVRLHSYGAVRKLLQMASGHLCLLCDSYEIYGLGRVSSYDPAAEDLFVVRFAKQFVWDLLHDDKRLMHVRYGEASIGVPGFPEEKFRADLPRVFPGIGAAAIDRLAVLARSAAEQKHGCMLVISAAAAKEAERLDSQCTRVVPFLLDESALAPLTAIDGSVLIDTAGDCHAIGVILDGMASPKCSPERGARYNSAVRYVSGHRDAMAVVKSEDGMVSVFPRLRPQVRRSEIHRKLESLRRLARQGGFDGKELGSVFGWLEDHEFYLTRSECEEANRLHEEIQAKKPDEVWYAVRETPLAPNPEMDDSHYLPE
ncbi:MAG: diadenylate cyclase [Gemmataceae bacterium]|nr:diadenylate cyclase [Gemmataceae bacterium]